MKATLIKLFGLSMAICCLGAADISDDEVCFPNACGEKGQFCQTPSYEIWNEYCAGKGLKPMSASGVYSGICYHEAANRDPLHPHHGVVIIDKINGKHHFGGQFAFYAERNLYRNLDIKEAKNRMPWFSADSHQVKWKKDHARVVLNSEAGIYYQIDYFLKKSLDDNNKLLLVSYWKGTEYRVFCELKRNE